MADAETHRRWAAAIQRALPDTTCSVQEWAGLCSNLDACAAWHRQQGQADETPHVVASRPIGRVGAVAPYELAEKNRATGTVCRSAEPSRFVRLIDALDEARRRNADDALIWIVVTTERPA